MRIKVRNKNYKIIFGMIKEEMKIFEEEMIKMPLKIKKKQFITICT